MSGLALFITSFGEISSMTFAGCSSSICVSSAVVLVRKDSSARSAAHSYRSWVASLGTQVFASCVADGLDVVAVRVVHEGPVVVLVVVLPNAGWAVVRGAGSERRL